MGVDYYAVCHRHRHYAFITDNKSSKPNKRDWDALRWTCVGDCQVMLVSEYDLPDGYSAARLCG